MLAAAASALLIAPSAYDRIEFRADDKRHVVFVANRLAIVGFGFRACAMTGSILLVTDLLFATAAAIVTATATATGFGVLWYVLPLCRRRARRER